MNNQLLIVNGTDITEYISSYELDKMELDIDSGRNLNGVLERNILSHHPRKIIASIKPVSGTEMASLLTLLDNPRLTVNGYNPFTNSMTGDMTMYHGDLRPVLYWKVENVEGNSVEVLYQTLQIELVEY